MSNDIQGVRQVEGVEKAPRRILLEKQINYAIQKAQKHYQSTAEMKTEMKTAKPRSVIQHLGTKVDIRV